MSELNEYSDSDDDVCFAPYTLTQAKKEIRKYAGRRINKRHSAITRLNENPKNTSEETYFTASETDRPSQNSEFLEKLTKVINEPVSETSYNTTIDQTVALENKNYECEDTFLKQFKDQTTLVLDNIRHTLVENTVISNEGCTNEANDYNNIKNESYSSEDIINCSVITISDDSLLQNSAYEFIKNEELNVSESPVMSNGEFEEPLSEATDHKDCNSSSKISNKSEVIDHTNSLYEGSTSDVNTEHQDYYSLHDESKATKSHVGFRNLNECDSDTGLKQYSCNINLKDSSEDLSNSRDSSEDTLFNLKILEHPPRQRYERVIVDCNQLSRISEKTEFTTYIEDNKSSKRETRIATPESFCSSDISKNSEDKNYEKEPRSIVSEIGKTSSISGVSKLSNNSEVYDDLQVNRGTEIFNNSQSSSIMSPNEIPEIELEQFDDSGQFNDTLDDMNRFLAEGVDYYVMPQTTPLKETPFSSNDGLGSSVNTLSSSAELKNKMPITSSPSIKISSSSVDKCKKVYCAKKITKRAAEVKGSSAGAKSRYPQESKIKPPSVSARNVFTKHTDKLEVENAFKVPTKSAKKLATPSKLPRPALKNVVSPVGIYIRHSPKYCPTIRVPQNTGCSQTKISKLARAHSPSVKENIPCSTNVEFPAVIYNPAKTKIAHEEKEILLPGSIKKLIREEVVIKHEARIKSNECNQSIERRLMDSDFIDLNSTDHDISVLSYKQAFDVKKL